MIRLASSLLSVDVLPEVGGKIGQITEMLSGTKFLVSPQKEYRTVPHDGDWLRHDTSGMDDCFPNVAAGLYPDEPWSTLHLPDLGEWTHGSWDVLNAGKRQVVMTQAGRVLPYSAIKTVQFIDEGTLEFSYRVRNRGQSPMRFLWSAHPLISVEDVYKLELPGEKLALRSFPDDGFQHTWPILEEMDLSRQWIMRGKSRKVFVTGLADGWCSLWLPRHKLHFTFDLEVLPAVGLWFNHYAFPAWNDRQFRCIAVEPCTSPSDLLDELDISRYPRIPPQDTAVWSMRLSIEPLT